MKKKVLLGLLVLSLGLSACMPDSDEDDDDSYVPGIGYEHVLSPSASFYG